MAIFGKGGIFDFSLPEEPEEQEALNAHTWGRLIELGMATEEYQKILQEGDSKGIANQEGFAEIATMEAEYHSRPWWQKLL